MTGFYNSRPSALLQTAPTWATQLFKTIETSLGETADPCMSPFVKELLCREEQPGPSTAPQYISMGHCFPLTALHVGFFILAYCDFIQAAPAAFNSSLPLTV